MSPSKKADKPLVIYTRVSRQGKRTDSELLSHALQERRIREYAEAKGIKLADIPRIEDMDVSGGKMQRAGLDRVLAGIKDGIYGGVAVARLTRFARSLEGGIFTLRQIDKAGGQFVACDSPFDTTTAQGRAMMSVALIFAQLELETVREYSTEMRRKKVGEGAYISGRPPAGYDKVVTGKRENGKPIYGGLKPNRHAKAVREAFELRAKGGSWREVADLLTRRRVPNKSGEPWSLRAASKLIANRAYLGEIRNGGVKKTDMDGDVYDTDVIINPKAHKALVSDSLFRRANRQREERAPADPDKAPALLGGLLVCGTCGHKLVRDFVSRKNAAGETMRTPFYRCRNDGPCTGRASVTHARVEPFVVDAVLEHVGTIRGTSPLGENPDADEAAAAIAAAEAALADVKAAREEFKTPLAWGLALDEAQAELDAALDAEVKDGRETYAWYVPGPGDPDYIDMNNPAVTVYGEPPTTTRTLFEKMPPDIQHAALRSVVERVVVKKGAGTVEDRCSVEWKS